MSTANERQPSAPDNAERLPDAGHGADSGGSQDFNDGIGDTLSPEDTQALENMRLGKPIGDEAPGDGADGGDQVDPDADDDAGGDADDGGDTGQRQEPGARQPPKDQQQPGKDQQAQPGAKGPKDGQQQPGAQDDKRPRTISRDKFERETLKLTTRAETAEAALRTKEAESIRLGERVNLLQQAFETLRKGGEPAPGADGQRQQPQPSTQQRTAMPTREADPEPDPEADPFGHSQWTRRELARTQAEFAELRENITQRNTQQDQQASQTDLVQGYARDMQQAFQSDPVNAEAYDFLKNSRYRELGYTYAGIDIFDDVEVAKLTESQQAALSKQISDTFHGEEIWLAEQARKGGPNAAVRIRQLAQARGFAPQPQQQRQNPQDQGDDQQQRQPARRGNGQQQQPQQNGRQQLRQLRDNVEDSRSLSDAHATGGGELSMERLANMDDADFAELMATLSPGKFNKLLGA